MDLEQLIENYQPTEAAVNLVKSSHVVLLVGISGAGKDTIKHQLLKRKEFRDIISHTTRLPRNNMGIAEVDGADYHFISLETAQEMVRNNEFVEAKFVHGTVYGTSIKGLIDATKEGIAVTDIDIQGVEEYKAIASNVVAIFILPPNYETWRERLRKRYGTDEEFSAEFPKRRESAIRELKRALEVPYYHFVINEDLQKTVDIVDDIAKQPDVFHRKDDEARLIARDILDQILKSEV